MPACPVCSRPLPRGSAAGVCPDCLLTGTLEEPPDSTADARERQAGGYDLLERIGRGGMGVVYRARQRSLDRIVAVKMVAAAELASPETLRRFRLEAEAAARLSHPGLVPIHEVGEHDGLPFYSMEYIPGGRTLAGLISGKPMPPHAAAACMEKVARAVHHAHVHGVLHRDLKPSNILLDEQGEPRVADFGLARQLNADSSLTISRNILGSPAYMPPEQAGGRTAECGPGSDVYALGAVLYHCLTGRPPFAGESVQTVLLQVRDAEPVPPRRLNPSLPRDLDTITLKCLEKSPARRYPSAEAFADELARFLRGDPVLARPLGPAGRLARWTRRHPAVAGLAAALTVTLAGGLGIALYSNRALAAGKRTVETALAEKSAALDGQTRALADALISRAESAARTTGLPGQRTAALEAIRQASQLPLTAAEKFRARNAALTALAMPEAAFLPQPQLPVPGDWTMAVCTPDQQSLITATFEGKIEIRRVADGSLTKSFSIAPQKIDCLLGTDRTGAFLAFRRDRTRLGILHTGLGLMPLNAEPWPDPAQFRPGQVTFGRWPFTLRPLGIPAGREVPLVCWPEPDGSIVMADPVAGFRLLTWPPAPGSSREPWTALEFSRDGRWLAAAGASPARVDIRQMPKGELKSTHEMPGSVHSLRWVPWGGRVAAGLTAGGVRVVDPFPRNDLPLGRFPGFDGFTRPVVSVDFSGLGILAASEDGTTRLWDRQSGTALFEFPASAWRTEFDDSGMKAGLLLNGGVPGFVEFKTSPVMESLGSWLRSEASGPHCPMPNGLAIALLHEDGIDFNATGKYGARNLVALDPVLSAVPSPDSDWLLTGHDGKICRLPVAWRGTKKEGIVPGTPEPVLTTVKRAAALALNADATLLAVADERAHAVFVHPVQPGAAALDPPLPPMGMDNPMACSLSPDGRWVAAGSSVPMAAAVASVKSGEPAADLASAVRARNWRPVFSSDGRWLAVAGRTCSVFAAGTWEPGPDLDVPPNGADHHGAAFYCPPGQPNRCLLAVIAGDREIHVFRLSAGPPASAERLAILRAPGHPFVTLPVFDHRGRLTVAVPRAQLLRWSLAEARRQLVTVGLEW